MSFLGIIAAGFEEISWICYNPAAQRALDDDKLLKALRIDLARDERKRIGAYGIINAYLERQPPVDTVIKR